MERKRKKEAETGGAFWTAEEGKEREGVKLKVWKRAKSGDGQTTNGLTQRDEKKTGRRPSR